MSESPINMKSHMVKLSFMKMTKILSILFFSKYFLKLKHLQKRILLNFPMTEPNLSITRQKLYI